MDNNLNDFFFFSNKFMFNLLVTILYFQIINILSTLIYSWF